MPDNFKGTKLDFQIANIEDSTFPRIPEMGQQTSLPADQLILQSRTSYSRHQLLGINLFALEMFDQFRTDLGLYRERWVLTTRPEGIVLTPRKMRLMERSLRRRLRLRK